MSLLPLHDFTRDKEAIAFREHFCCVNDVPRRSCTVLAPSLHLGAAS
jgi:hypothetical protein